MIPFARSNQSLSSIVATTVVGGWLAVAGFACGSDPLTQSSARDQAATQLCNRAAACLDIGPTGATYTSVDDCLTKEKSAIQALWPEAECTKIDGAQLDMCLAAIKATPCDANAIALADLLVNKCPKAKICPVP